VSAIVWMFYLPPREEEVSVQLGTSPLIRQESRSCDMRPMPFARHDALRSSIVHDPVALNATIPAANEV